MKKKLLYIAAIVICLSVITGGTLSYRTVADTARNVITSSGVSVEILEQQLIDGTPQPYPSAPIPVMPTSTVSKIVSVRNIQSSAWVRMKYTLAVSDANGDPLAGVTQEELEQVILIDTDDKHWTEKADGWFYYNTALDAGETSEPLFTEVTFSGPKMDNKYQNSTLKIHVAVQSVQKANNGESVWDAAGWPEA